MNNKKREIQQNKNQLEEINNEKENTIKSLQEQIQSLKEDIKHYRSNPNNKENILEHTDHNYLGNHQTQNTLHTNVNDHKYDQPEKTTSVRTLLKMCRINKQIIPRIMKQ